MVLKAFEMTHELCHLDTFAAALRGLLIELFVGGKKNLICLPNGQLLSVVK